MTHDNKRVESKSSIDAELVEGSAEHGGQPTGLAGVGEEEDDVGLLDEGRELLDCQGGFGALGIGDGMAGHGDEEDVAICLDGGDDGTEVLGGGGGLVAAAFGVVEGVEGLA